MKEAILVVSFGTSYEVAKKNSLDQIFLDVTGAFPKKKVYEAYSSSIIRKNLARENRPVMSVSEALETMKADGISIVTVLPTHMIPGIEYKKLKDILRNYESSFEKILLLDTVLQEEKDCEAVAALVVKLLQVDHNKEYILMGHGTEDVANIRYVQMNEAFLKLGYHNLRIASVEAKPDLEDTIESLYQKYATNAQSGQSETKRVLVLHPFMVVAGDHAQNDMAGEEDSFKTILEEQGYQVEAIVKGLGEYPGFRQGYIAKLQ